MPACEITMGDYIDLDRLPREVGFSMGEQRASARG
jgi:hypothetical protein